MSGGKQCVLLYPKAAGNPSEGRGPPGPAQSLPSSPAPSPDPGREALGEGSTRTLDRLEAHQTQYTWAL